MHIFIALICVILSVLFMSVASDVNVQDSIHYGFALVNINEPIDSLDTSITVTFANDVKFTENDVISYYTVATGNLVFGNSLHKASSITGSTVKFSYSAGAEPIDGTTTYINTTVMLFYDNTVYTSGITVTGATLTVGNDEPRTLGPIKSSSGSSYPLFMESFDVSLGPLQTVDVITKVASMDNFTLTNVDEGFNRLYIQASSPFRQYYSSENYTLNLEDDGNCEQIAINPDDEIYKWNLLVNGQSMSLTLNSSNTISNVPKGSYQFKCTGLTIKNDAGFVHSFNRFKLGLYAIVKGDNVPDNTSPSVWFYGGNTASSIYTASSLFIGIIGCILSVYFTSVF